MEKHQRQQRLLDCKEGRDEIQRQLAKYIGKDSLCESMFGWHCLESDGKPPTAHCDARVFVLCQIDETRGCCDQFKHQHLHLHRIVEQKHRQEAPDSLSRKRHWKPSKMYKRRQCQRRDRAMAPSTRCWWSRIGSSKSVEAGRSTAASAAAAASPMALALARSSLRTSPPSMRFFSKNEVRVVNWLSHISYCWTAGLP